MKKLILFLGVFLFGANLINVDFFNHQKFVDILFSLDNKFQGKIVKLNSNKFYLKNVKTTKRYFKKFDNSNLSYIEIYPYKEGSLIVIDGKNIKTKFDLTPEGYGIRLRIETINIRKNEIKNLMQNNPQKSIDYVTYFLILAILIILAIILFIVKKKIPSKAITKDLMKNMNVIAQKPIDTKNKIILFEFNKRKYLMLIGTTNILLDVLDENMINISSNKEFDDYLKLNNKFEFDNINKYIRDAEELKETNERI